MIISDIFMRLRKKIIITEYKGRLLFAKRYNPNWGFSFGYQDINSHTDDCADITGGVNLDGEHYLLTTKYTTEELIDGLPRRRATKAWRMIWYNKQKEFAAGLEIKDSHLIHAINEGIDIFEDQIE